MHKTHPSSVAPHVLRQGKPEAVTGSRPWTAMRVATLFKAAVPALFWAGVSDAKLVKYTLLVSKSEPRARRHVENLLDFQLTNGTIAPDGTNYNEIWDIWFWMRVSGNTRESWLINGQTPGPHLTFDEGDQAEVSTNPCIGPDLINVFSRFTCSITDLNRLPSIGTGSWYMQRCSWDELIFCG